MDTGKDVNTGGPTDPAGENLNSLCPSKELRIDLPQDPAELLALYLRGIKHICTAAFIVGLWTVAKLWN